MQTEKTALDGVIVLTPRRLTDNRGWFSEAWNRRTLRMAGIEGDFVQDNHSFSAQPQTLRGLHYQAPPHAQDKLVRCTRGAILDVVVDARRGAPTYGDWLSMALTAENGRQLLVPKGFLHGFITREPETEVQYKCTDYYAAESDGAVRWDSLAIDWQIDGDPVLSAKDAAAPRFEDWTSPFVWENSS